MSSLPSDPAGLSFPGADKEWGDPDLTPKQPQGPRNTLALSTRHPGRQAILSSPRTKSFTMLAVLLWLHSKKFKWQPQNLVLTPSAKANHLKGFKKFWWHSSSITRSSGGQWAGTYVFKVSKGLKTCYGWLRMGITEPEFPSLLDHITFLLLFLLPSCAPLTPSILCMVDATIELHP